ncbi:MAG: membrane-binding protein [Bacteroidota bacterium]
MKAKPASSLTIEIPSQTVDVSDLLYDNKISMWTLDGQCYSGYAISRYPDGRLKQKFGLFEGKKHQISLVWYPDGHLKFQSHYHLGKLHGEKNMWASSADHLLISQLNYFQGKAHGLQRKWYPTGELFKELQLNMGREEGQQRAFRKNGDLFANYEAKNGRIFGLKRASLCFGLADEEVQYKGD